MVDILCSKAIKPSGKIERTTMTRKDFELIAEAVRVTLEGATDDAARMALHELTANLCANLKQTHPQFNAERFAAACKGGAK